MSLRSGILVVPLLVLAGCADQPLDRVVAPAGPSFVQVPSGPVVNSLADPGAGACDAECTLREAIALAQPGSTIHFAAGLSGVIALDPASGQLVIDKALTIVGPGAGTIAVRGNYDSRQVARVLAIQSAGVVQISGLTFEKGYIDAPGACIYSNGNQLSLTNVVVQDCVAFGAGGGVGSDNGSLTITGSTVRGNWAANGGGGVYNNFTSSLSVNASTISNNEGREGGGIGTTGAATIVNSTISGNRGRAQGGGVYHQNAVMTIAHSTIASNTSASDGGGVFFYGDNGSLTLAHTIVALNANGGGVGPDCAKNATRLPITSAGYNLIGDDTGCALVLRTGDLADVNPLLGALADNGGPTATRALQPGSPAINAGDPAYAGPLTTDQRGVGYPRIEGGRIDIGAFEAFAFPFEGFFAPIANLPALNSARAGQVVPVKFSLGGDEGLAIFAAGYPKSEPIACPDAAAANSAESTVTAGASGLSYDAETGMYIYTWKTDRGWAGSCRRLTVMLTDGSVHQADFQFR